MVTSNGLRTNVVGSTGSPDRLLLLIHGYGADEHDLAPLGPILDPAGRFHTVCPRGPLDLAPFGGAAWYERTDAGVVDPGSFGRSVAALDELIGDVCTERGFDRAATVVVGFSQGGAMALAVSWQDSAAPAPAGVACLSGMLQTPEGFRYRWDAPGWDPAAGGLPAVLVQHGTLDPMVPIERGRLTVDTLRTHGLTPRYHEYAMHHEIRPESVLDLRAWLGEVTGD